VDDIRQFIVLLLQNIHHIIKLYLLIVASTILYTKFHYILLNQFTKSAAYRKIPQLHAAVQ